MRDDRALACDPEALEACRERRLADALGVERVGEILGDVHVDARALRIGELAQRIERVVVERHHRVSADERAVLRRSLAHLLEEPPVLLEAAVAAPAAVAIARLVSEDAAHADLVERRLDAVERALDRARRGM